MKAKLIEDLTFEEILEAMKNQKLTLDDLFQPQHDEFMLQLTLRDRDFALNAKNLETAIFSETGSKLARARPSIRGEIDLLCARSGSYNYDQGYVHLWLTDLEMDLTSRAWRDDTLWLGVEDYIREATGLLLDLAPAEQGAQSRQHVCAEICDDCWARILSLTHRDFARLESSPAVKSLFIGNTPSNRNSS